MISLSSSFSPSREENVSHDFRNYFFARWLRTLKAHTSFTEGQLSTQRNEYDTTPHYVWIVCLRFSRVCFLSTILFVFLTFLLHSIKNELRLSCQWFRRTQCNKRGSTPTRVCFFIIASLSYSGQLLSPLAESTSSHSSSVKQVPDPLVDTESSSSLAMVRGWSLRCQR